MLSFETFATAVSLKLTIPVDVKTFGGISLIASELNQVESQRKKSGLPAVRAGFDKGRGYRLLSFEVHSPPQVSVLADPSWLAVYIALVALGVSCLQLLGSYASVKTGAKKLAHDLGGIKTLTTQKASENLEAIGALSKAQRRELALGVQLYIEQATNTVEKAENIIVRATWFISILRRQNRLPTLEARIEPTISPDA